MGTSTRASSTARVVRTPDAATGAAGRQTPIGHTEDRQLLSLRTVGVGIASLVIGFIGALLIGALLAAVLGSHVLDWYVVGYAVVGWWSTRHLHHSIRDRVRSGATFRHLPKLRYAKLGYVTNGVLIADVVVSAATHGHPGWVTLLSVLGFMGGVVVDTCGQLRTRRTSYDDTTLAARVANIVVDISEAMYEHKKVRQAPPIGAMRMHKNADGTLKIAYSSLAAARRVANEQGAREGTVLNSYECSICHRFHVGHAA